MTKDIKFQYESAKDIALRFDNWKALDALFENLLSGKIEAPLLKSTHLVTDYIDLSTEEEE